jgi:hypothetical protein
MCLDLYGTDPWLIYLPGWNLFSGDSIPIILTGNQLTLDYLP